MAREHDEVLSDVVLGLVLQPALQGVQIPWFGMSAHDDPPPAVSEPRLDDELGQPFEGDGEHGRMSEIVGRHR